MRYDDLRLFLIIESSTLNSKSEWQGYKIPRLTVEKSDGETKEQLEVVEFEEKVVGNRVKELKERVVSFTQPALTDNNNKFHSRKRVRRTMQANYSCNAKPTQEMEDVPLDLLLPKKRKTNAVKIGDATYDLSKSMFNKKNKHGGTPTNKKKAGTASTPKVKMNPSPVMKPSVSSIESLDLIKFIGF